LRIATVTTRFTDARQKLDQLWRVAQSLNPDLVLARGYARVEADGHVVPSAARAIEAGRMRLIFADGSVEVATADSPEPAARPKPRPQPGVSLQPRLL
jgi:exodeoxyribonuclease VII large subunit